MKKIMKFFFLPFFVFSTISLVGCDSQPVKESTTSSAQQDNPNSIMISEIVDGKERKNLAIELFNNTDSNISLEDYRLDIQFSEEVIAHIPLKGTIISKETYVFVHKDAVSDGLKEKANGFIFFGLENENILYNGKQSIALVKEEEIIDVVGTWNSFGIDYATDRTLTRKKEFLVARTNFDEYDWIRYNVNEFSYLGTIDTSVTEEELLAGPRLEDKDLNAPFSIELENGDYLGGGGVMDVTVSYYVDGDTTGFNYSDLAEINKLNIQQGAKVRYQNIDTPESYEGNIQRFGIVAKNYTNGILKNAGKIRVQTTINGAIKDTFNRVLAWVWADEKLVNFEVVKRGYSEVAFGSNDIMLYKGVSYTSYLYNAMLYAEKQQLGVHGDILGQYGEIDPYWDYENNHVKDGYKGNEK